MTTDSDNFILLIFLLFPSRRSGMQNNHFDHYILYYFSLACKLFFNQIPSREINRK